jgi:hypothetical protein
MDQNEPSQTKGNTGFEEVNTECTLPTVTEEVYEKRTIIENSTTTLSDERSQTKDNTELEEVKTECTLLTVAEYPSLPSASAAYGETYAPLIAKRLAYVHHDTGNAQDIFASGGTGKCDILVSVHMPHAYAHDCAACPWPKQMIVEVQAQHTRLTFDRGRQNNTW